MRRLGRPKTTPTSAETKPAHDDPDENIDLREDRLELVAGIGADAHEGAGSERQKPGISGQQVEPDRASERIRNGIIIVLRRN